MVDLARLLSPLDAMEWSLRHSLSPVEEVARYFALHAHVRPELFELEMAQWVEGASSSWVAWEVVAATLRRVSDRPGRVPAILEKWAVAVALGKIKQPSRPRGRPAFRDRDAIILEAIEALRGDGYSLDDACEAIAEHLESISSVGGIREANGVLKIYRRRPRF